MASRTRKLAQVKPSVRPRRPEPLGSSWGVITTFAFLWAGILHFLALVSYTPEDIPAWLPIATTADPNNPPQNFIGVLGAVGAGYSYFFFGAASYLIATGLVWFGLARFVARIPVNQQTLAGFGLFVLAGASLCHLQPFFFQEWDRIYNIQGPGGSFGWFFGAALQRLIGTVGSELVLGLTYGLGLIMLTGFHPVAFVHRCRKAWREGQERRQEARWSQADPVERVAMEQEAISKEIRTEQKRARKRTKTAPPGTEEEFVEEATAEQEPEEPIASPEDFAVAENPDPQEAVPVESPPPAPKIIDGSARRPKRIGAQGRHESLPQRMTFQGVTFENYKLPPLDLLQFEEDTPDQAPADESFLFSTQNTIVDTLANFGLEVHPADITRGPTITRYEIRPAKGLRVNRIVALEADIARATKAERINIIAPIPGKDTVGVEIANKDKVAVPLRELLDDPLFSDTKYKIPLALGKDVYGNAVLADLASMPHLLVAGATGSGKSVCINSIIASLLFQFSPEQLRFIMIDPKVVEMQIYNDLPHLVVPVVTDPKKVILALRWVVKEMERRYQIFAKVGKRNFDAFNNRDLSKPAKSQARAQSRNAGATSHVTKARQLSLPMGDGAGGDAPKPSEKPLGVRTDAGEVEEDDDAAMVTVSDDEAPDAVGASVGDDARENPPFFVHQVNVNGRENAPAADEDDGEEEADVPWGEDEDPLENASEEDCEEEASTSDEGIPPHEFELPAKGEENEIPDSLPYIVVIIDELADLMQTAPADVEVAIGRITQMARAAGIHLIVATQTPRADVITGTIKANIPCRIAFQVSSGIDSRVILDAKGADRLVGKGDMLYLPPGTSQLVRAQGALISDEEIQELVEFCCSQGDPAYEEAVQETIEGKAASENSVCPEDEEILAKCLEVIRQEKRASTSLMQRRLGLGYTRAARMMDILEERGYVGPGEGAKPREIFIDTNDIIS